MKFLHMLTPAEKSSRGHFAGIHKKDQLQILELLLFHIQDNCN